MRGSLLLLGVLLRVLTLAAQTTTTFTINFGGTPVQAGANISIAGGQNVTGTMPNEVVTAIDSWRLTQKNSDGSLKYASAADLLKSIIGDTIRDILQRQPTPSMEKEIAALEKAKAQINTLKKQAVQ